jgi:hypothetical protein
MEAVRIASFNLLKYIENYKKLFLYFVIENFDFFCKKIELKENPPMDGSPAV